MINRTNGSPAPDATVRHPAMPTTAPDWDRAVWIGVCDESELAQAQASEDVASPGWLLAGGEHYRTARFLIRRGPDVRGSVEVPVSSGRVQPSEIARQANSLPLPIGATTGGTAEVPAPDELISVIICTKDRPDTLRQTLVSVLRCADQHFEVVVVDNASTADSTARVVTSFARSDSRVRFAQEPIPGLSRARNRGAEAARGTVLAFCDDDVIVDPGWLTAIRVGMARSADVACVTGLVPTGELRTPTQAWFDRRVTWGGLQPRVYRLSEPPPDADGLFPLQVGQYGTGASMAIRRQVYLELGGADELLGAGTVLKGGEDIDLFVRLLRAGHALAVEPNAIAWHRHRSDEAALRSQVIGYGRGLGAWLTKLALSRGGIGLVLSRVPAGIRRLTEILTAGGSGATAPEERDPIGAGRTRRLNRLELWSLLGGPYRYLSARLEQHTHPELRTQARVKIPSR